MGNLKHVKLDSNMTGKTELNTFFKEGYREDWEAPVPLGDGPGDEEGWIAPEKLQGGHRDWGIFICFRDVTGRMNW